MALCFRACLLASSVAFSGAARAAPAVDLMARPADADCVSAAELERRVRAEAEDPTARRFEVRIRGAESGGWHAVVSVLDAEGTPLGERTLATADHDCHDLDAALFVVLGALLDGPVEARVPAENSSLPTPERAVAPLQPRAPMPAARDATRPHAPAERDIASDAAAARGTSERPAFTAGSGVSL
ncbi:MAG TPA: hypothetical protein VI072_29955, partial [Polyangiaceae bacterium]